MNRRKFNKVLLAGIAGQAFMPTLANACSGGPHTKVPVKLTTVIKYDNLDAALGADYQFWEHSSNNLFQVKLPDIAEHPWAVPVEVELTNYPAHYPVCKQIAVYIQDKMHIYDSKAHDAERRLYPFYIKVASVSGKQLYLPYLKTRFRMMWQQPGLYVVATFADAVNASKQLNMVMPVVKGPRANFCRGFEYYLKQ
jgi:hypothetical protein